METLWTLIKIGFVIFLIFSIPPLYLIGIVICLLLWGILAELSGSKVEEEKPVEPFKPFWDNSDEDKENK